jgi:hypothetical protein
MKTSPSDLNRIKTLLHLGDEESFAELWAQFELSPGQAQAVVEESENLRAFPGDRSESRATPIASRRKRRAA